MTESFDEIFRTSSGFSVEAGAMRMDVSLKVMIAYSEPSKTSFNAYY